MGNVSGSVGNFSVQNRAGRDFRVDTHVAYGDAAAKVFGQNGGAGFGAGQIDGLHPCHRLRGAGYALVHDAVVSGEHQKIRLLHPVVNRSCDARQLDGQFLQPTQTPGGLGELGLTCPRCRHGSFVRRLNRADHFCQKHGDSSISIRNEGSVSVSSSVKVAPGQSVSARLRKARISMLPRFRALWVS